MNFRTIAFVVLILLHAGFTIAAPTITANPNPVNILFTAKSGTTTIQWDAEANHPNADVWLSIDGGSETLFDGDYHGIKSATIQIGKSYTFKLYTSNKTLLDSVIVTAKQKWLTLPSDVLKIDFIKNIVVDPHGMFAKITFTTDSSSLPVVMVSEGPPLSFPATSKEDVKVFNQGDLVSSNFAQAGTDHEATLPDLEPDTQYHYVISVSDKGLWYKVKGKFRTLRRAVNVTFEKIKVVDDSDDFGGGDFEFGFFVNGQNAPNGSPMILFSVDLATGESKTINMSASLQGVPGTLQLKAIGYDDDEDHPCGAGDVGNISMTEGEDDCGEWSSDEDSFNIGPNAPDVSNPESFTKSFTLKAYPKGDDSDVSFNVTGNYKVSFVP